MITPNNATITSLALEEFIHGMYFKKKIQFFTQFQSLITLPKSALMESIRVPPIKIKFTNTPLAMVAEEKFTHPTKR